MERNSLEDLNKVLDYNFKNSLKLSPFKLSCPRCYKVYLINPNEIMSTRPKFSCSSCSANFYIKYPDFFEQGKQLGIEITQSNVKEAPTSTVQSKEPKITKTTEPVKTTIAVPAEKSDWQKKVKQKATVKEYIQCPKCEYVNSVLSDECIKCSVILSKVDKKRRPVYRATEELKDLWKLTLDNYDSEKSHQNFIRYSHLEKNLEFASAKYNLILSINPHDEVANKMKKQIIALSTLSLKKQDSIVKPVKSVFSLLNMWSFSLVLSSGIIGFGLYYPQYKNLIGIGASSLCLIICLFYLNSRSE